MELVDGWYVIADSQELSSVSKPLGIRRFGKDLVVWRNTDGQLTCMDDRCPHRFAKLSGGTVGGGCIECPFHGFRFDERGSCTLVPETGSAAANLTVQTHRVEERHGYIWMFVGASSPDDCDLPWFDELKDGFSYSQFAETWPCHITRCIENQLDYAHLPYVHKTTIGRFVDSTKEVNFEMCDKRIKFSPGGGGFIEFLFPNVWRNYITESFQLTLAFVPVDQLETKLYLRSYHRFNFPVLRELIGIALNTTNRIILNQDRSVVLSQRPGNSINGAEEMEKLYPSDRAIVHFREVVSRSL